MAARSKPHTTVVQDDREAGCSLGSTSRRHGDHRVPWPGLLIVAVAAILMAVAAARPALAAQDRVALVMAVEDYAHLHKSLVSVDTAQKIADALKKQGFVVSLVKNPAKTAGRAGGRPSWLACGLNPTVGCVWCSL